VLSYVWQEWPLTSFEFALGTAICYLLFVFVGMFVMKALPAVPGLYPFKFLYNMVQIMLCSYMCIESGVRAWDAGYSWLPCNPFNQDSPPIAFILYVFYLSKILDFMDTVFIIAEKRWEQLSFLHVYHHTSIFLFYWLNINVGYDSDVYLTIVLNGLIHTIMYTYYFVSLHTKDIWWKSLLTKCQMVQFVLMNAQAGYLLYVDCSSFPRNITNAYLYYILSLLILFLHFYIVSYVTGGKKKRDKKAVKSE
jgi:elongation of very long chain fatty acids protein 4